MKVFVCLVYVIEHWLSDDKEVKEQPYGSYTEQFKCWDHEQLDSV
jgi:hypothetical protein